MKLLGKLRCRAFGCGPHTKHALDNDIDLYVCDCCGHGVMDAPAAEPELWQYSHKILPLEPTKAGHVWYCWEREQARVRL